jgi:hypothetical protein
MSKEQKKPELPEEELERTEGEELPDREANCTR